MNSIEYWQERCDMAENLAETLKEAAMCNAEEARNAERACTLLLDEARITVNVLDSVGAYTAAHQLEDAIERAQKLLGVKSEQVI